MSDSGHFGEESIEVRPGGYPSRSVGAEFSQVDRLQSPGSPIVAQAVPLPLAARHRISWRIATLTLCLLQCRGNSATVMQLHILTWAIQSSANFDTLRRHWLGVLSGAVLRVWNSDLDDSIRVAVATGLVVQSVNGRQSLTATGLQLAQALADPDNENFLPEREQLRELGRISTAGMMRRLSRQGEL